MPGTIAVIEDDPALRRVLVRGLEAVDFQIVWAVHDGASALGRVAAVAARPDALVLDLGVCRTWTGWTSSAPCATAASRHPCWC